MNAHSLTPTPGVVLIADDDPEVRILLQRWLSDGPYEVRAVADADAALAERGARPIDVVICDVMMPGRDGLWLANQIRTVSPGTQVIFGTAVDDLPAMSTLRPGVAGYLVKPFHRAQVCAAVDQALQARAHAPGRRGPARLTLASSK